ncbi:MAG: hypothetical protein HYV01_01395 [Deltaproteobacteria bacterium]|nr:hypothetical protein [Deltaproteobacteria bacterium]
MNMSTVCSDKSNPVRHARGGGHPGWIAKELDSRVRGNDGLGHFPVGFKPARFNSFGVQRRVVRFMKRLIIDAADESIGTPIR